MEQVGNRGRRQREKRKGAGEKMIEMLYGWLQDMVFYLLIITAVLEVLPGGNYQKYIRFFTGMVLLLLLLTPVLALTDTGEIFRGFYQDYNREWERQERTMRKEDAREWQLFEFLPEEYREKEGEETDFSGEAQETSGEEIRVETIEVEEIDSGKKVE